MKTFLWFVIMVLGIWLLILVKPEQHGDINLSTIIAMAIIVASTMFYVLSASGVLDEIIKDFSEAKELKNRGKESKVVKVDIMIEFDILKKEVADLKYRIEKADYRWCNGILTLERKIDRFIYPLAKPKYKVGDKAGNFIISHVGEDNTYSCIDADGKYHGCFRESDIKAMRKIKK